MAVFSGEKSEKKFIDIFKFKDDTSKPGRVLSTVQISDVYMARLIVEPGVTTGNCYHKDTQVMFYVTQGEILAVFEQIETKEKKYIHMKEGDQVVHIPSYTAHSTKNEGDEVAVLVFFSDKPLRSPDRYPYPVL